MTRVSALPSILLLVACGAEHEAFPPRAPDEFSAGALAVTARGGRFDAPDSTSAGWHRVRFHQAKDGTGRNLVLFRVSDSLDLTTFAATLDTAQRTPAGAIALGGLESPRTPSDTADLLVPLQPGRYVWTSLTRGANGRRHVTNGMWRQLVVAGDSITAAAPSSDVTVRLADHAFVSDDTWPAGNIRITIVNTGKQDHLLNLMRLETDQSLAAYLENPGKSERVGGVSRMGPGQVVVFETTLAPGRYVALCLVRDPATGKMHMELGMARLITVQSGTK